MRQDTVIKLKLDQDAALRRDKLKSLELRAEIARLSHQPTKQHQSPKQATNSPTTPTGDSINSRRSPQTRSAVDSESPKIDSAVSPEEVCLSLCLSLLISYRPDIEP